MQENPFTQHIERCKKALSELATTASLDSFQRSSGFSLHFLTSNSFDGDRQKRDKLKAMIEHEIETYEKLRAEFEVLATASAGSPGPSGNLTHYLIVREAGRRGRMVWMASADARTKGMISLTGAGDDGLLARWRKFNAEPFDLTGANLSGLVFGQAHFDNAIMREANFQHTVFINCSFNNAIADGADFSHAGFNIFIKMKSAHFNRCNFSQSTLAGVEVDERTTFDGAEFADCRIAAATQLDSPQDITKLKNRLSEQQIQQLKKGCFVATAACGNHFAWEVHTLQTLRDSFLCRYALGLRFIAFYNKIGPQAAEFISKSALMQSLVRHVLIKPCAFAARFILRISKTKSGELTSGNRVPVTVGESNRNLTAFRPKM